MKRLNDKGFTLIELLIVTAIGVFIISAAYFLYSGALKLFSDVTATSETIQAKIPTAEQVSRYFDRWGVGVYTTGTNDCSGYPPSDPKCITVTTGSPCDEVTFWGDLYGTGFVQSTAGSTTTLSSCRLSQGTGQNCYYLWRNDVLQNDIITGTVNHLKLDASLSPDNADCSGLTAGSPTNATVNSSLTPWAGSTPRVMQAGDIIHRAPHKVRLYCAQNANDNNRNWLYVDLTDTSAECNSNETASPLAPVDSFKVSLLPASCAAGTGGCKAAQITMAVRSQAKKYAGTYKTESFVKVFGR